MGAENPSPPRSHTEDPLQDKFRPYYIRNLYEQSIRGRLEYKNHPNCPELEGCTKYRMYMAL